MKKRKQNMVYSSSKMRNFIKVEVVNKRLTILNFIKMVCFYLFSLFCFSQMWTVASSSSLQNGVTSVVSPVCGKGGNTCPNGQYCVYDAPGESPSYCISGSCTLSPFASCVSIPPFGLVPCGSGGVMCPTGKTCMKSDEKTPCVSGDCFIDSNSKCMDQSALACGNGGVNCSLFSTPEDPKICMQSDLKTPCVSGNCSLFGATCVSMNQLGCGKGGTKCDSSSQVCVQTDGKTPCVSGDCLKDVASKCVSKTTLECGKGGIGCEEGKVCASPDKRLVVPFDDLEFLNNSSNVCDLPSNLLCGHGGTACEPGSNTVCALADFSGLCKINQPCTYSSISSLFNQSSQKIAGLCAPVDKIPCASGGSLCTDPVAKCILDDQSDFCVTTECQNNVQSGIKKASCQMPDVLPCGKGGFKCPLKDNDGNALGCIKNDQSDLCKSSDCATSQSSCQLLSVLECGKGGLTCPQDKDSMNQRKCIQNDKMSECNDINCSEKSTCQLPSVLPCGKGGFACPISPDPLKQKVCVKNDFSDFCKDDSCSKSSVLGSASSSSCELPSRLPCGKGGSVCPKESNASLQTICMSKDFSSSCKDGDCMTLKNDGTSDLVCDLPSKLPCGKGGITCTNPAHKCVSKDKKIECFSGKCMNDKNYTCQLSTVLPCGKGGISCPSSVGSNQTVCILKDKTARCNRSECSSESTCQSTLVLPCGKGGSFCPKSSNPAEQQFCIKKDATGLCLSGDCLKNGASCQLKTALKCGFGGLVCPTAADPKKQTKCILKNKTALCANATCSTGSSCQLPEILPCGKGGKFCQNLKLSCINKENTAICNSESCFKTSTNSCKLSSQFLPCGKGGNRCSSSGLVCVKSDLTICKQGESCNSVPSSKCVIPSEALCGLGGTKCLFKNQVCALSNLKGLCKSGSCFTDVKSKCVDRSQLPCGSGGSLCVSKVADVYKKTKCILNTQSAACTSNACMETSSGPNGSFCQLPQVLPCGKGGIKCASGLVCATNQKQLCVAGDDCMDYSKNTCVPPSEIICGFGGLKCPTGLVCAKVDNSGLCTSKESCANSHDPISRKIGAYCANIQSLPCGKGGTKCTTAGQKCILNDQSNECKSGACVNSILPGNKGASCQNTAVLRCGQGGVRCDFGKICMLKDRTARCAGGSCMVPNIAGQYNVMCDLPHRLLCGKGGNICPAGQLCYMQDLSAPCTTGACMLSGDIKTGSKCIPSNQAKCGLGGSLCSDPNTTCVQKDGTTPCLAGACQNDKGSKCALLSSLECGKGGVNCPSDKVCMYNNKSAACSSGTCAKANAAGQYSVLCDIPAALACGKGGSKCANNQLCIDAQLNSCTAGDCLKAVGTKCASISTIVCGKGGVQCPTPATGEAKTYCSYKDTGDVVKSCTSSACMIPQNILSCLSSKQITCGLGGLMCPVDKMCVDRNQAPCLDGQSCMSDAQSSCIDPKTLVCGKGGLSCPEGSGTICAIKPTTSVDNAYQPLSLCQITDGVSSPDCLCVPATQQDCGKGGSRCPTGQMCLSKDGSLCANGACLSDIETKCQLPCGKGGVACLKGLEDSVCVDKDNKPCLIGEDCSKADTSRCVLKKDQLCGSGGVFCANNQICMKPDHTVCTIDQDCKSQNTSVCSASSHLGCGMGGSWCLDGQTCVTKTFDTCKSGGCMSNPESRCMITNTSSYVSTTVLGTGGIKGSFTGKLVDFSVYQPYQIALMMGNGGSTYTKTDGAQTNFRCAGLSLNGGINLIHHQGNWSFTAAFDKVGNLYRIDGGDPSLFFVSAGQYNTNISKRYNDNDIINQLANLKMALDSSNNVYIINKAKKLIKKVTITQNANPTSGNPTFGNTADLIAGSTFEQPSGIATDTNGNVYVADSGNHVIYKYVPSTNTWSIVAGISGQLGYSGDGGPAVSARLNAPSGVAIDASNNMYIADANNQVVRVVDSAGMIKTMSIAGKAENMIPNLSNIKVDILNNIYVQSGDNTIYMLSLG